jgi:hypothetical protein
MGEQCARGVSARHKSFLGDRGKGDYCQPLKSIMVYGTWRSLTTDFYRNRTPRRVSVGLTSLAMARARARRESSRLDGNWRDGVPLLL